MAPSNLDLSRSYKINNVKYSNQVADLIFSNPNGPISGYTDERGSPNQSWKFIDLGNNEIAIQNTTTNTYAFAYDELEGLPITASSVGYAWILIDVQPGVYRIATTNGAYVWSLESGRDLFSILLRNSNKYRDKQEAQWALPRA